MLHLGVADCVGQYPVVRTLTVRSTPPSDTCGQKMRRKFSRCNNVGSDAFTFSTPILTGAIS